MTNYPCCTKVCDDILFIRLNLVASGTTYRCIHLPTLVVTTQHPGGSIDLTENAFAPLLPECKFETCANGSVGLVHEEIYSIPSCLPNHPRYCFVLTQYLDSGERTDWEILEVEIDLSIPGPIKIFSRVSRQYTVACPANIVHHSVDDLLLSADDFMFSKPLEVRFLQVGKPDVWRELKLGKKIYVAGLQVDRDAGCIIVSGSGDLHGPRGLSFIWWVDDRKPGAVVQ